MGEDLRSPVGEHKSEFVGKPFPVVEDFRTVFFLFFPAIGELDRAPMGNVTVLALPEDSIEHSCRAKQSYVAPVQWS